MNTSIYDAHSFWELLNRRVADSPDRTMLIDDTDRTFTFAEVHGHAERVAAGFATMGVGEGTPVTWVLPTRVETIVASLALSRLGAVQNPIIHIYREREVGFCIRQTGAELVLVPGEWNNFDYKAMVETATAHLAHPPAILEAYDELPDGDPATLAPLEPPSVNNGPIRWIYYTSGTTSDPKGAMHTDASLIAGGVGLAMALDTGVDDVGSIAFPYAHIGGPDYLVCMLANGFPAVLIEKFDLAAAIDTFNRHRVTMAGGSTAFYTMFLGAQRQQPDQPIVPSLRMLSGGGAPKPPAVYHEVVSEMGMPVAHGYGMTESPMICQGSPHDTADQLAHTEGRPVYGAAVTIARPDGSTCDPGEEGEVVVAGPQLFKGYKDPDLNVEAFDEQGRFRTGDLGVMRSDGHVSLTGRVKDIIIRKGENISAKEIEDILYTHPKVAAVAVVGLADPERGERVCAVVETAENSDSLEIDEMVAACSDAGLMRQKVPEQLVVYEGPLPRNATLKILKYRLRDELVDVPWP
ncbi:MAG: AMP-binding protein [Actinomycetota bacterium]|nr:AMP-binding protein [Actinomycetota bacterium]